MSAESAETNERFVEITRTEQTVYRATNKDGDSVTFGQKPGMFSPVELLLAGLAGCTSVSVDIVSSRRAEPTVFKVRASATKVVEESGANQLEDLHVAFDIQFPEGPEAEQATKMLDRLVALSHDKHCTVARTIESGPKITTSVNADKN